MSRMLRVFLALVLLCLSGYVVADSATATELNGVCLTPMECFEWCNQRGCCVTTGCDPSTGGCFCDHCY